MAYSYIKVTAAAGQTSVPFNFDYLATSEIKVKVNDVETTAWSLSSPNVVALDTAMTGGEIIEIERVTDLTTRAVDFASGAVLTEEDLDLSAQQVFNAAQEALDSTEKNLSETFNGQYDAKNKRIVNIADGVDPQDAITKSQLEYEYPAVLNVSNNMTDVNTVSNNIADVNEVQDNIADVNTVASNIASVNTVADNIDDVITVANDLNEAVSELETVANDLNEATSEIEVVADNITDVNTVGTNITNVNKVAAIDANVTTVSGISTDVTAVANNQSNINNVASNESNVNTVAGISTDVTTVADNVTDVTNFANVYQGGKASDPSLRNDSTSLQAGDLYFNTTVNELRTYSGSQWVSGTAGTMAVQRFTGDGTTTVFTLSTAPSGENNTQVYVNGIYQQKDTYSVSGTTLTLTEAPQSDEEVEVVTISTLALGETDASLVSYTPSGTGAVVRTVQSKLGEFVSVKDFGAVGDGVTHDRVKIQELLDFYGDEQCSIYFPKGTYLVDGNALQLHSNTVLFGEGTLKCLREDDNTKVLFASGKENIVVRNLRFHGNFSGNNTTSLPSQTFTSFARFADCKNVMVERCSFTNTMGTALQFASSENITVDACSFTKMRTVYTGNFFISVGGNSNNYLINNCSFIQPESWVPVPGHSNAAIVLAGETTVSQVKNGRITGCYFERTGRYADTSYDGHDAPRGDIDIYNDVDGLVVANNISKNCQYMFFKSNDCSHIVIDGNIVTDSLNRFVSVGNRYGNYPIEFITISNNVVENASGIKMDGDGNPLRPIDQVNIIGNTIDLGVNSDTWAVRIERAGVYVNISDNNFIDGEIEVTGVHHNELQFPNTYKKYSICNNRIDCRNQVGIYGIQLYGVFNHPVTNEYVGATIRDNTIINTTGGPVFISNDSGAVLQDNYYYNCGDAPIIQSGLVNTGGFKLIETRNPVQADGHRIIFDTQDNATEYEFEIDLARPADGNGVIVVEYSFDGGSTWETSYSYLLKDEGSDGTDNVVREQTDTYIMIAPHNSSGAGEDSYVGSIRVSPRGHLTSTGQIGDNVAGIRAISSTGAPSTIGTDLTNISISCWSRFGAAYYFRAGSIKFFAR